MERTRRKRAKRIARTSKEYWQCTRKFYYDSWSMLQALRHAQRLEELDGIPVTIYHCRWCEGLHIGRDHTTVRRYRSSLKNLRRIMTKPGSTFFTKAPAEVVSKMLNLKEELVAYLRDKRQLGGLDFVIPLQQLYVDVPTAGGFIMVDRGTHSSIARDVVPRWVKLNTLLTPTATNVDCTV